MSVRLPTDRESGTRKGFGYVEFADQPTAIKAFEGLQGKELFGRPIRLDYSHPRDNSGGGGARGGDRGGRGTNSIPYENVLGADDVILSARWWSRGLQRWRSWRSRYDLHLRSWQYIFLLFSKLGGGRGGFGGDRGGRGGRGRGGPPRGRGAGAQAFEGKKITF